MADVDKLREKKRQIEERIKRIEAAEKSKKRKEETRRKIIIGGAVMAEAFADSKTYDWLMALLEKRVTTPKDRLLFLDTSAAAEAPSSPSTPTADRHGIRPDTDL